MKSNQAVTALFAGSTGSGPPSSTGTGVSDTVWCAAPAANYCHFTETLTTLETIGGGNVLSVRAAGKRTQTTQAVVVGKRNVKLSGGHAVTFTIELNKTGRQLLKQFGKLPVTLRIELLRVGKLVTIAWWKLTIKPKKPHKKVSHAQLLGDVRLDWPVV
jgi:hypothetical protein